jgi:hypothetical protein
VSMIQVGNSSIRRTGKEESSSSSKKAASFDLVLSMTLDDLLQVLKRRGTKANTLN